MPLIRVSENLLHYTESGEGPPLVLLHANPGDSRDWEAVIPALSKRHRVIALDWPGYGNSTLPLNPETKKVDFFYQTFLDFVSQLGLSKFGILGNSVGGWVAARYASDFPERVSSVILIAPGGFTPHSMISRLFCKLQGSRFSLPPHLWARMYLRKDTLVTREMLNRARTSQAEKGHLILNRSIWRSFLNPEFDLREKAKLIQCPVLLMFGEKDPAISSKKDGREAAKAIPHAEFVVMDCGHAPFAEIPDAFLERLGRFLEV
ncbi:MAG: alpha/beta hydrolase [Bdellovibrionales bacterium]|nr:alpha/beta hydrolase [Bdellovibrionales bacterium]